MYFWVAFSLVNLQDPEDMEIPTFPSQDFNFEVYEAAFRWLNMEEIDPTDG